MLLSTVLLKKTSSASLALTRISPLPLRPDVKTQSSWKIGVGIVANGSLVLLYRHRYLPDLASTPTTPLARNCTYCRDPAALTAITEPYPAASPSGTDAFHTVSPVFLLSATSVASLPPGVLTTTSPSINGDSAYAQFPTLPAKSD